MNFFDDYTVMMSVFKKNAPWYFKPFILIYGVSIASIIFAYYWLCHFTCRKKITGQSPQIIFEPTILGMWHTGFSIYLATFLKLPRHIWLTHPLAYMAPWYFVGKMMGIVHLIPGSSGHEGFEASEKLLVFLKEGYSTSILPDGPTGPVHQLRKGILHMAAKSGLPIIPLRSSCQYGIRLPTWDNKIIPIPFISRMEVHLGESLFVTHETIESAAKILMERLS